MAPHTDRLMHYMTARRCNCNANKSVGAVKQKYQTQIADKYGDTDILNIYCLLNDVL